MDLQCFSNKIELSPVGLLSFFFSPGVSGGIRNWDIKTRHKISRLPSLLYCLLGVLSCSYTLRGDKCSPLYTKWFCGAGLPVSGGIFEVGFGTDPASLSP